MGGALILGGEGVSGKGAGGFCVLGLDPAGGVVMLPAHAEIMMASRIKQAYDFNFIQDFSSLECKGDPPGFIKLLDDPGGSPLPHI